MRYANVLGRLADFRISLLCDSLIGLLGRRLLFFWVKNWYQIGLIDLLFDILAVCNLGDLAHTMDHEYMAGLGDQHSNPLLQHKDVKRKHTVDIIHIYHVLWGRRRHGMSL